MNLLQSIQTATFALLNLLTPPVCQFCRRIYNTGHLGNPLCDACLRQVFPECVRCIQCGLRLGQRLQDFGWRRCRHCRARPNDTRTWVAGDYRSPQDTLAKALKFGGQRALAGAMGRALAERWTSAAPTDQHAGRLPDVFMPVPVSTSRLRERGYNQAALIAQSLAGHLQVAVDIHSLVKSRETGRQASLSAQERHLNLVQAFDCARPIEYLHVGLVDDVMTTGATLDACTQALCEAGASTVSRWLVWRTPEKTESLEQDGQDHGRPLAIGR